MITTKEIAEKLSQALSKLMEAQRLLAGAREAQASHEAVNKTLAGSPEWFDVWDAIEDCDCGVYASIRGLTQSERTNSLVQSLTGDQTAVQAHAAVSAIEAAGRLS